jgi:hypothetical protein
MNTIFLVSGFFPSEGYAPRHPARIHIDHVTKEGAGEGGDDLHCRRRRPRRPWASPRCAAGDRRRGLQPRSQDNSHTFLMNG